MSIIRDVIVGGVVNKENSTIVPLGIGGVFTGEWVDILKYSMVFVNIYADEDSAASGLSMQQSSNGVDADHNDDYSIPSKSGKSYSIQRFAQYFRIVYTNGSTEQTEFRLQTILSANAKGSSHRIGDEIVGDDDAELVKAAITGENGDGAWHNVQVTADGNLAISDQSSGLSIAEGNVTGKSFVHKFGKAPDFDILDGFVSIWDGADDSLLGGGAMSYTYSATADIGIISSSNAGDTVSIEIQGLDSNYDLVVQTVTLTGQTDVDISSTGVDLIRVFRLKNVGAVDLVGTVYVRTNGSAQTDGVPNTANTVRAIIDNGNNQTLMAIYTVPNGKTGYMRDWFASTAGAKKDTIHEIKLFARPQGQVFQLKHDANIVTDGSSYIQHFYTEPEVFQAKTDIEIKASTGQDEAGVSAGFDIVLVDD